MTLDTPSLFEYLANESLNELELRLVQGERQAYSFGKDPNLDQHVEMIRTEFVGKSEIELYHALLMVMIRRRIGLTVNIERAHSLWTTKSDFLCRNLDSRWLVSACDTIMEFWPEDAERALAATGSLFVNTIKLYESERWATNQMGAPQKYQLIDRRIPLHDGLSAYVIGRGDMIMNLHRRIHALCANQSPAGKILLELLARASRFDTVFKRFHEVHTNERTSWRYKE